MRIGINGFEAVVPRFGFDKNGLPHRVGSSEVCYELLINLAKIDKKNDYIVYLPTQPTPDMPAESDKWCYKVVPGSKLWTIFGLTREMLKRPKLDVFFSPTHYGPLFTPCPEVISILDTSYKLFPEMFNKKDLYQLSLWGGYSVRHASKIITISNSSKSDIIREYSQPAEKVAVAHLGIKDSPGLKMNKKELFEKYNIQGPYILFVGTIQPRKNITRLIEAFSKLESRIKNQESGTKNLELIIIGRRGWDYEETLAAPAKFGVENHVRFLEEVTDDELPLFYENAKLFVLPSLYEGFGLPVLEAMKYGCPVVTSNISSLPEAGGDAALYFDPENVTDITQKIEKVLKDDNNRSKMIKAGHEQVKKFSWEKSAKEVLEVLTSVALK